MTVKGIDKTEYAWAAGIADADGSFYISKSRDKRRSTIGQVYEYVRPRFNVSQSGNDGVPDMMLRMKALFPFGKLNGPYAPKGHQTKERYTFIVHGHEKVQQVVAALWPWMGKVKRDKATLVLNRFRNRGKTRI